MIWPRACLEQAHQFLGSLSGAMKVSAVVFFFFLLCSVIYILNYSTIAQRQDSLYALVENVKTTITIVNFIQATRRLEQEN